MGISGKIDNSQLMKALSKLPKNIQNNVMVGATRVAANVVRDEARILVPKRTGNLSKSIQSIRRKAQNGQITFTVTPSKGRNQKNDGWYAHFIEFGTVKQVAQPFMRPAFESSENEALQVSKQYIATRLPQEVMKAKI